MNEDLSLTTINENVLRELKPASLMYYVILLLLFCGIGAGMLAWIFQVKSGMEVTHLNHPVGWGLYITNFVFWVGIAHSGTFISAILFLTHAKWRDAVSRSAEAMTIIAVLCAGMYPLIHLGRVWLFYYILPYPSERMLWPNFKSPLVWDVVAVFTYLTVSIIFFYVGLIPDAAAARDRYINSKEVSRFKKKFYEIISLGWSNSNINWKSFSRAYLYFAALATPLVISVHSVVSWDFAVGILPGWHSTIYAPYFVAGAIHSGLAMTLTLLIPMRKFLNLEKLITIDHFEFIARTIIVTTLIIGYAYFIEPFILNYSGSKYEFQFQKWLFNGTYSIIYWGIILLNVVIPLLFVFRKVRRNLKYLFIISIIINIGMWFERLLIVTASTSHDFLPHNWDSYFPGLIELLIAAGTISFFFFCFLVFSRALPVIPISDFKAQETEKKEKDIPKEKYPSAKEIKRGDTFFRFIFKNPISLTESLRVVRKEGFNKVMVYSPVKLNIVQSLLGQEKSPVRIYTLIGAICGCIGGYLLASDTSLVNNLIVGGKQPVNLIPYTVIAFEGTVLIASLFNFLGLLIHSKLFKIRTDPGYDASFSNDKFALLVAPLPSEATKLKNIVKTFNPEEENEITW